MENWISNIMTSFSFYVSFGFWMTSEWVKYIYICIFWEKYSCKSKMSSCVTVIGVNRQEIMKMFSADFCLISHTYFSSGISTEALSLEGPLLGTSANEYHMLSSRTLSGRLLFLFVKSLSWCNELILTFSVCQKKNLLQTHCSFGKILISSLAGFFSGNRPEKVYEWCYSHPNFFFIENTHWLHQ